MSDPHFASVELLAFNESGPDAGTTFDDASDANRTLTANGNAQWDTAQAPTGLTSTLALDGTGDYVTTPYVTADFNWWTDDFTIEAWVYYNSFTDADKNVAGNPPTLVGNMSPTADSNFWSFGARTTGVLRFFYWTGTVRGTDSSQSISLATWTHIAMCKTSSGIQLFVGGQSNTPVAIVGTPLSSASFPLSIGQYFGAASNVFVGSLRITKGVARYTANFTPPSLPLPTSAEEPAAPAPTTTAGTGGRAARRKPERWSLTVDGEAYVFSSLDALIAFLDSREVVKVEDAEEKAERDAKRVISLGRAKAQPAPPKVNIVSPTPEISEYADAVQKKVDRMYWRALADALSRQAEEDEDVAFIASLDL